ncbi:MAG: CZB domain-containing protein [Magnetococcales bacterium]|nr:CZB domain-containing protein [Magnetococcales bacterium]
MKKLQAVGGWGLRTTMLAIVASLLLASLAGGGLLIYSLRVTVSGYAEMGEVVDRFKDTTHRMNTLMLQCRRSEKDFLLGRDARQVERLTAMTVALEKEAGIATELAGHPRIADDKDAGNARRIGEIVVRYRGVFLEVVKAVEAGGGNLAAAEVKSKIDAMRTTVREIEPLVEELSERIEQRARRMQEEIGARSSGLLQAALWVFGILTLLSLAFAAVGVRRVLHQIGGEPAEVSRIVARIAGGDLTVRGRDGPGSGLLGEIVAMAGRLREMIMLIRLQGMSTLPPVSEQIAKAVERLSAVAAEVRQTTAEAQEGNARLEGLIREQVKTGADYIVHSMGDIGHAVIEQSRAAGTVSLAAEEGSVNTSTLASAAEEISANVAEVNRSLEEVSRMIDNVAESMDRLTASQEEVRDRCRIADNEAARANTQAQSGQTVMEQLTLSAHEIGQIVQTINHIAEQTNMLALNASIEAAGAGDAGKGFAVVANEVKDLARQTAEATQDIGRRIHEIQEQADAAARAVGEITEAIERLADVNREIVLAADEQSMVAKEISLSMDGVSRAADVVMHGSQELGGAVNEIARTATALGDGSRELALTATTMASSIEETATQAAQSNNLAQAMLSTVGDTVVASQGVRENMERTRGASHRLEATAHTISLLIDALESVARRLNDVQASLNTGAPPFDMIRVKTAHLEWLRKLEEMINGAGIMSPEEAGDDHACQLGQWFFSSEGGGRFAGLASHGAVDQVHRQVHALAANIIRAHENGQEVRNDLQRFNRLRDDLFHELDGLFVEAARHNDL